MSKQIEPRALASANAELGNAESSAEGEREVKAVSVAGELHRAEEELSNQQTMLVAMERKIREQEERLGAYERMQRSISWRLAHRMQNGVQHLAPAGTVRAKTINRMISHSRTLYRDGLRGWLRSRRAADATSVAPELSESDAEYQIWLGLHTPSVDQLRQMRDESELWSTRPLLSIILPVYNAKQSWLHDAIASVLAQAYSNWQLCIADDASSALWVKPILQRYSKEDKRIVVKYLEQNVGIAAASNAALTMASGDYVTFLDHDDVLQPHALYRVAELLRREPDLDFIYSDEDKILTSGERGVPNFKPEWSPELLLGVNYCCHLSVLRRSMVEQIEGFRAGFDGSQDHDLLLRFTERTDRIRNIPDVLYSWRQVPGSVSLRSEEKPEAYEAARRAIDEALVRRGRPALVSHASELGRYSIRYEIESRPSVAIVIPTRDRLDLLDRCLEGVEKSTYPNFSVTIIDNDSSEPETLEYLSRTRHELVSAPGPFNYSRIINLGVRSTDAEFVLLLNNDVEIHNFDWIDAMLGYAQHPETGAVGARLLFPGGDPQHEGIVVGLNALPQNMGHPWPVAREISAVTGACLMVRRTIFDEVGGFDESLQIAYNDVDFCLRIAQSGYRNIYTPGAVLTHAESSSRGKLSPTTDTELLRKKWGDLEHLHDPYVNPNVLFFRPLHLRLHG